MRACRSGNHLPGQNARLAKLPETFARQSSWEWNFGQAPAFRICWMNALAGAAWNCISTLKRPYHPRPGVYRQPQPRAAGTLAGRLQGGLYRADMLQQECKRYWLTSRTRKKSYGSYRRGSGGGKVTR